MGVRAALLRWERALDEKGLAKKRDKEPGGLDDEACIAAQRKSVSGKYDKDQGRPSMGA